MKKLIIMTSLIALHTYSAHAFNEYSNAISAHNITNIQHAIAQQVFSQPKTQQTNNKKHITQTKDMYGQAPMYGQMQTYGEYNDEGFFGRNGGDTQSSNVLSNIWVSWQHNTDTANYTVIPNIKTNTDIVIIGLNGDTSTTYDWGIHSGYTHTHQTNTNLDNTEQSGFFGISNGFSANNFDIQTILTGGVMSNSTTTTSDTYTNFWLSGNAKATYTLNLDKTFAIRPAIYIGYTWIKPNNYTSTSNTNITNSNFNALNITPEISAIKHIGNQWYGTLGVKYIMTYINGDTYTDNILLPELNYGNYFEYSLNISKQVYNTNVSATIGRHDGNIYGWFGNINIKYLF